MLPTWPPDAARRSRRLLPRRPHRSDGRMDGPARRELYGLRARAYDSLADPCSRRGRHFMTAPQARDRVRVVICDDVPDHADILTERLTLEGFDARAVYNGAELLELVRSFEPHCVLFDIVMPGLDGLELARRLREACGDDVVLLAMTGKDVHDARVVDTFRLVDHYFQKPVPTAVLLKMLRSGLG